MLNLMELEEKCRRFLFSVYAEANNSEEISLTFSTIEDFNENYFDICNRVNEKLVAENNDE